MTRRSISLPVLDPDTGASRRTFLSRLWKGLGLLASAEILCAVAGFLAPRSPEAGAQGAGLVEAGPVSEFAPGSVRPFPQGKFYLVRLDDGGFMAFSSRCTHLGCPVGWDEQRKTFPCPCHGSTFDLHGEVSGPPAVRALDLFAVVIEAGVVKVDTSRRVQRSAFDPAQVAHL